MSTLATSSALFLSSLRNTPREPAGKLERSEAPKIQTRAWTSSGKKKERFCFDDLNEDCFKIAASAAGCFWSCGDYQIARVTLDGHSEIVWINVNSMAKRFDLPQDVILSNLSNLGKIIRLVQEKRLFQTPSEEVLSSSKEDAGIPLLSIPNPFPSMVPLEKIAKIADEQSRCFRLSKRCYHLAKSIDVFPGGFFAIDTGELLGAGASARVKASTTLQGIRIARRKATFYLSDLKSQAEILRQIKILNEFRGKIGILDTLAMGVYENKRGMCVFISIHPRYDQDFNASWKKKPSEKDRLKMTHELLQGFRTIAEKGVHRDISYSNIFLLTTQPFKAVIGDLEFFRYHDEEEDGVWNHDIGPERYGIKREVWDVGKALYYMLQSHDVLKPLLWGSRKSKINQENLDKSIQSCDFPPEIESLLRGMLALDPNARWTAEQSLEYFEKYLSTKQL